MRIRPWENQLDSEKHLTQPDLSRLPISPRVTSDTALRRMRTDLRPDFIWKFDRYHSEAL